MSFKINPIELQKMGLIDYENKKAQLAMISYDGQNISSSETIIYNDTVDLASINNPTGSLITNNIEGLSLESKTASLQPRITDIYNGSNESQIWYINCSQLWVTSPSGPVDIATGNSFIRLSNNPNLVNSSVFNNSVNSNSTEPSLTYLSLHNSIILTVPPKNWIQFNFGLSSVGGVAFHAIGKTEIQILRLDKLL